MPFWEAMLEGKSLIQVPHLETFATPAQAYCYSSCILLHLPYILLKTCNLSTSHVKSSVKVLHSLDNEFYLKKTRLTTYCSAEAAEVSTSNSEGEAGDSEAENDEDVSNTQLSEELEEPEGLAEQPAVQGRKAKRKLNAMEGSLSSLKKKFASASRATKANLEPSEQGKHLPYFYFFLF